MFEEGSRVERVKIPYVLVNQLKEPRTMSELSDFWDDFLPKQVYNDIVLKRTPEIKR